MRMKPSPTSCLIALLVFAALPAGVPLAAPETSATAQPSWQWAGWGGGGFYYSAVFHPTKDGVIYLGGDVAGMYKSEDHGRNFKLINNGLADYGVFSLAASLTAPDCVYAATVGGLCKSTDGGEHWRLLPETGPKALRITGEKDRSIRCIAVDPANASIVYAGSPAGKVYKSADGGETWKAAYEKSGEQDPPETLRVQFGKVNDAWFGGLWFPFAFPQDVASADCAGFGFNFKGDGTLPQNCYLTLKAGEGATYRSRDLREIFKQTQWGDVTLSAKDFILDPDYAKKNPDKAKAYSGTPDWSAINRLDLACVNSPSNDAVIGKFTRFFFALTRTADGKTYPASAPYQHVVREFSKDKSIQIYSNARVGALQGGAVYSVAVAQKEPSLVIAATDDAGLVISRDAGQTWSAAATPKKASSIAVAPSDPNILYATFFKDGLWKSSDKGQTWQNLTQGFPKDCSLHEVAVSPANPLDVYVIGAAGWNGRFFLSNDGGKTWTDVSKLTPDLEASPTLPKEYTGSAGLSTPKNITINPLNPKELYIAANWRPCHSEDGGRTWTERVRRADISCVFDLRFHKGRTYASAMDEGVLVSEDNGKRWRQLCPLKYDAELSGHYWRLAISDNNGADRIVSTCSPWDTKFPNRVVMSEDGGKTFTRSGAGLPATVPSANTMWGIGYARAMAADPRNPKIFYLGIDGDPSPGKSGGGAFKSEDGGKTWNPLPNQPGSRRMFFGLAVDPTDSNRVYWGACGTGGGLYRSEDAGASWQLVFKNEQWIFNVHLAADGTVYCPGANLWRSTDHGKNWKQITKLPFGARVIVAVETDPTDAKRMWYAATTWGGGSDGGVYETRDSGATWQEITGDLPYRKPLILRYNPDTRELWAAGVCIYKCRR
ncbi:MAG: hypothetical protein NTX50_03950 [Candidatus Sumerlaeota bacterium]|nr:hypothetical protein [Candidatus Sumerlaeota bacterium]